MNDEINIIDGSQTEKQITQLPFSEKKQDAVLGHLLTDAQFFMQARHKIKPKWFLDPICAKVWDTKLKFYNNYNRIPTVDELREWGDFVTEEPLIKTKMLHKAKICLLETQNFGKDVITKELQGWLQAIMFKDAAEVAKGMFLKQDFEKCFYFFGKQLDTIKTTKFIEDREFKFEDYLSDFEKELIDRDKALTFGIPVMDEVLLSGASQGSGSLLPGDQTILLSPTNVGKSTTLLTIIAHNIRRKKSVLFFTHEGRPADINFKLWQNMIGCTKADLFKMVGTVEGKKKLDKALEILKQYLVYVPYTKAGMTVEDIDPIIRMKQEERIAKTGAGFDLFVSDYPAKLGTKMASQGALQLRNILDVVYNHFVNLALEYNWHSLVAYQANREAAKINKGLKEEGRFLVTEDAGEAYGPMQTAANVISINRDPIAQANELITFFVTKTRSSVQNVAVTCKSNFACAITHSAELGGTAYRATSNDIDKALDMMKQYPNAYVPDIVAMS
jgi:hypothetical protein